jgi:large subunit ribosomal protein L4e
MKAKIISQSGKQESIEMPGFFGNKIREDIAQKFYESSKKQQPYAPFYMAGKQNSASGILSKSRRLWKNTYGKGISRVPRKILWRRGDHFYWQGAEIASTRGGRPAHPPQVAHFQKKTKINKKETIIALQTVIAATASSQYVQRRYLTLKETKLEFPIIIDGKILEMKTKQFFEFLEKTLGEAIEVALQSRKQRAGKGKARGRRYKKTAGMLLVIGKDEKANFPGIDVRSLENLDISDFYPLGRLTMYTENAVKELNTIGKEK